ncbi:MAG: spore cortex biosynthesis protein YabQ [Huintestinicola sp.]|uniref:spore cortex biosynthesis protein YabQ n=1 Tax=Huintestinicola sp. TaxID=2981661 RepID=UPI003EFCDD23
MPVCRQTELFLLSVLLGGCQGVLWDVFRALRAIFPVMGKTVPTAICDGLYLILCGIGVYIFSLLMGDGQVRGYYWLGALLGAVIYILTAGTVVIGIIRCVFGTVYRLLGSLFRKISKPFIPMFQKFGTKKGYKFVTNAKKMFHKCKYYQKDLKSKGQMVYNKTAKMK